jgi:hypothetical protein
MPLGKSIDALPLRLTNIIQPPEPVAVSPELATTVVAAPLRAARVETDATAGAASASLDNVLVGQVVTRPATDAAARPPDGEVLEATQFPSRPRVALAPSLNLLNEVALKRANQLRPDLRDVFKPRAGIPRSQLKVPICRNPAAQSQPALLFSGLLEEPALSNPQAFCYLPRYKLAVADAVGGQQLRVRLEREAQGGKLTVHLSSYADPAIELAARNARAIDAPRTVELRYPRMIGGQTVWDAWTFQEIADEPGGFQAVLHVDTQSLPQLHLALQTNGTTLVVRRTLSYAIGVASEAQPPYREVVGIRRVDVAMRRRPIDDSGDVVSEPPYNDDPSSSSGQVGGGVVSEPPPPYEELFEARSAAVEDTLACSFPASYDYIFQDGVQTGGPGLDLQLFTKQWHGRAYNYYQDPARPWRFFYLPDAFKIARQDTPPRVPAIKLSTTNGQVTMTYAAAPFTDAKRLEDAARQLSSDIPPGTHFPEAVTGPRFVPLTTVKATFRLALPGSTGTDGPLVERPNVGLDFNNPARGLPGGIYDTITMPLEAFLPIYDALCSSADSNPAHSVFWGEVSVTLGDTPQLPIPFVARLNDLVGEVFSYEEAELPAPEYPDLVGVRSRLANVIESSVRLKDLPVTLHRTGDLTSETRAVLRDPERQPIQLPITLAPGESLKLLVMPEVALAGDGPCDAVFDLAAVEVLPDREKVLDAIVDPNVPMTQMMPVAIKVLRAMFGKTTDAGGALHAVSVKFPGRGQYGEDLDVDLTAGTLDEESNTTTSEIITKTVMLYMPARGFLLRQSDPWSYGYNVTLRRAQGDIAGESGTRSGTSFWPKIV